MPPISADKVRRSVTRGSHFRIRCLIDTGYHASVGPKIRPFSVRPRKKTQVDSEVDQCLAEKNSSGSWDDPGFLYLGSVWITN